TDYHSDTGPSAVVTGDFNGDGRADFATANYYGNSASILLQAATASLSVSSLSFLNQNVGTTSAAQPATITNSGSATLTISNIAITGTNPGDFSFTSDSLPISLAPAGTTTVQVTFSPTVSGNRSAVLGITDNASGSPQLVNLSGTGIGTTTTVVASSVNPSTVGQSVTFTATVAPSSGTGTPT